MDRLSRATCTLHSISAQTSQEVIKRTKAVRAKYFLFFAPNHGGIYLQFLPFFKSYFLGRILRSRGNKPWVWGEIFIPESSYGLTVYYLYTVDWVPIHGLCSEGNLRLPNTFLLWKKMLKGSLLCILKKYTLLEIQD